MYANEPEMAKKWSRHTPKKVRLPESIKSAETTNKHMTNQEQAYINGFVKRANQHGLSDYQAIELLKQSDFAQGLANAKQMIGGAVDSAKQLGSNVAGGIKNFVANNGVQATPAAEEQAAYNQRARENYVKQMPRQPAGQQLPPPVR